MCGILCLVRPDASPAPTLPLVRATEVVRHRGPDDEGYLLWRQGSPAASFAGEETAERSRTAHRLAPLPSTAEWQVGFGHRRLSILDLSPAGHQPAIHRPTGLAITYNGEIYNYRELRRELETLGHEFHSRTDTEVLLVSWAEWGEACLNRLNGMFAFTLLDPRANKVHVVRDRFGVKPLYSARAGGFLVFASECKQIRALPGYRFRLDESSAYDYLALGVLDHTRHTFDAEIQQVLGGEHWTIDLAAAEPRPSVRRWYELTPQTWRGSDADAASRFRELLADSVRLRLRADVPVGSCLSGGLDSSAIVCLAREALKGLDDDARQVTVTSCFDEERFDEWRFARLVVEQSGAETVRVFPSIERLRLELDRFLWHQDEPFGSTSQFSQWCVFAAAAGAGLIVMLDGQGSDEQLAGYHGSTATALLSGQLRRGAVGAAVLEMAAAWRRNRRLAAAQAVLAVRNVVPPVEGLLPKGLRFGMAPPGWLRLRAPSRLNAAPPRDLDESLRRQTLSTSLPALLRYEDRSSMAWSIEARLPFLDYRLVEFLAALPERLKLRRSLSKVVLREALAGVIPEPVRQRRDKMGFVTPEEAWLRDPADPWLRGQVTSAAEGAADVFDVEAVTRLVGDVAAGRQPFSFAPWRILCFGRWMATAVAGSAATLNNQYASAAVGRP